MSDRIDAPVESATESESNHGPVGAPAGIVPDRIPAQDLVRLAQGFYFIFWGLLVAVVVGAQVLVAPGLRTFAELFLGGGVAATLVGTWRLHQASSLAEPWTKRTPILLALAGLLAYFCVFFYLWRRLPTSTYLLANVLAFIVTGILYVIMFSRTVSALATVFGRRGLALESQAFSAGNIGLLLLPFAGAILYVMVMAVIHKSNPLSQLQFLLGRANLWVLLVVLLPFSLTLSLAWACKDAVLRQLASAGPDRAAGAHRS